MSDVEIKELKCLRCGYSWYPRIFDGKVTKPDHCARCNSPYWNKEKVKFR